MADLTRVLGKRQDAIKVKNNNNASLNLGLTNIIRSSFFGTKSANGLSKDWLISMGGDIQSLAIPAKGYESFMNHTAGLTSLEILYPRLNLEVLSLLPLAVRMGLLVGARCVEYRSLGSTGAVIA